MALGFILFGGSLLAALGPGHNDERMLRLAQNTQNNNDGDRYWTPDRLKSAKPLPLPSPGRSPRNDGNPDVDPKGSTSGQAQSPSPEIRPDVDNRLFEPRKGNDTK
jgi:hypothetical protein